MRFIGGASITTRTTPLSLWATRSVRYRFLSGSSDIHLLLGWFSGGEEVDEQLCDALGRVVMHPVRGAEQALDAVQVGHVVVVGLG